jgi:hypothetical protein
LEDIVLTSLLAFFVFGLVGLVMLTVMFALVAALFSFAIGVAGFLLFKIAPFLLIGWLVLKLVQRAGSTHGVAATDRRWLDE